MAGSSNSTWTREQIHALLWDVVAKHTDADPASIQPTSRLVQDLGADSLGVIELSMELEETLGIKLPEDMADNPKLTLADIEAAICSQCG